MASSSPLSLDRPPPSRNLKRCETRAAQGRPESKWRQGDSIGMTPLRPPSPAGVTSRTRSKPSHINASLCGRNDGLSVRRPRPSMWRIVFGRSKREKRFPAGDRAENCTHCDMKGVALSLPHIDGRFAASAKPMEGATNLERTMAVSPLVGSGWHPQRAIGPEWPL